MKDYEIIGCESPKALTLEVKAHMKEGWIPFGGMSVTKTNGGQLSFFQAIVLMDAEKIPSASPRKVSITDYQQKVANWKSQFSKFHEFSEAYPIVNITRELDKASLWLYTNSAKRKKAFDRFFNNWCARIQEKGVTTNTPLNPPMEDL